MKRILLTVFFVYFAMLVFSCELKADKVRKAAVSGTFYPAKKEKLEAEIQTFLRSAKKRPLEGGLWGLIVPHAGYIYSGQVAAWSYAQIDTDSFDTIVLIGSSHSTYFPGASVGDYDYCMTPLGSVPVNREITDELLENRELFHFYPLAHEKEHALEVQIPFLQNIFKKEVRIVTVLMGGFSLSQSRAIADKLISATKGKRVLFIASTDLSHYYPYDAAVKKDIRTIEAIESLVPSLFYEAVREKNCELCGYSAVLTLICMAEQAGAQKITRLKYANSGDVPAGDKSRVVGYAAMAITK